MSDPKSTAPNHTFFMSPTSVGAPWKSGKSGPLFIGPQSPNNQFPGYPWPGPPTDCNGFGLDEIDDAGWAWASRPRSIHRDGDPLKVEVHGNQLLLGPVAITFHRTLRIPDDGKTYPLPPSLGSFPIRLISDYADKVPESWRKHGGVFLPLYQREAMWLSFNGQHWRPNALKVGVGKINALTGEPWSDELEDDPQDYLVVPEQPWLDGINAGSEFIRQFVAMPLGMGYTVEGQITGDEVHGGIQLCLYEPESGKFPDGPSQGGFDGLRGRDSSFKTFTGGSWGGGGYLGQAGGPFYGNLMAGEDSAFCSTTPVASDVLYGDAPRQHSRRSRRQSDADRAGGLEMGMAGGGKMHQKIYPDSHGLETWDQDNSARVFVHVVNSQMWQEITGEEVPETPVSAASYSNAGLPWFDLYDEDKGDLKEAPKLKGVKSVKKLDSEKGLKKQDDDETVDVPDSQVTKINAPAVAAGIGSDSLDGDW